MGFASVNAFVCDLRNPCNLDSSIWYYNIYNCDMTPLLWCRHNFQNIEARCGHLQLNELPPGCYIIAAIKRDPQRPIRTYPVLFQARCNEDVCLKLIPETIKVKLD